MRQVNGNTVVDLMGIGDDSALQCLAENLCQPHNVKAVGIDNIFQHVSRPNRRELIHVPPQGSAGFPA